MKLRTDDELMWAYRRSLREHGDEAKALRAVYILGHADAEMAVPEAEAVARYRRMAWADIRAKWWHVVEASAARHGFTVERMLAVSLPGRSQALHEAMWLLREAGDLSYPIIGKLTRRHHTVVMDAVRKMDERVAAEPGLRFELLALLGPAVEAKRGVA